MNSHQLTPKQSEAVCHLLEAPSVAEAARRADVARSTLYEWLKQPAFSRELAAARRAEHQARLNALTELLPKALNTLSGLLESDDPRLRLKAACEIVKSCQDLADKSASAEETTAEHLLEDDALEGGGRSLAELTRSALRRMLNGTLDPKTAQMLPSYLKLLERLSKEEPGVWAEGEKGDEMKLIMGLLDWTLKPDISSDDPLLASFQAEAKHFLLERGWSQRQVESLMEESRSRYSSVADGEGR